MSIYVISYTKARGPGSGCRQLISQNLAALNKKITKMKKDSLITFRSEGIVKLYDYEGEGVYTL